MTTVQDLIDRQDIIDVLTRYANTIDDKNWEGVESCFTEDAILDYSTTGKYIGPKSWIDGVAREGSGQMRQAQHYISNFEVEINGDEASTRTYLFSKHVYPDEGGYTTGGVYIDKLRRTPNGWRIFHRSQKHYWKEGDMTRQFKKQKTA